MDDFDEQLLSSLSPRIKVNKIKRIKGPTVVSLKKHFRRSSICNKAKPTIPNACLSIIEISSTLSGSSKSTKTSNTAITKSSSSTSIDNVVIPQSPENTDIFKDKEMVEKMMHPYSQDPSHEVKSLEINKWLEDVNNYISKNKQVTEEALEATVLSYDDFETRTKELGSVLNSTMVSNFQKADYCPEQEEKLNKTSVKDKESESKDEDITKSCENLLDDLYGISWRLQRNKILPNSEKHIRNRKIIEVKEPPKTERKINSELFLNPYLDSEKSKSNKLLKMLQTKRIKAAIESPYVKTLKNLIDDEYSFESAKSKHIVRTKLFDSDEEYDIGANIDDINVENKVNNLDDKENSWDEIVDIPLEERIKKKLQKSKNDKTSREVNKPNIKTFDGDHYERVLQETNKINSATIKSKKEQESKKKQIFDLKNGKMEEKLIDNIKVRKNYEIPKINSNKDCQTGQISTELRNVQINEGKIHKVSSDDSDSSKKSSQTKPSLIKILNKSTNSFLASLSKNIPDCQCHPSAKIFKATYKNNKEDLANKLFALFNEKVFDNGLPATMQIEWSDRMLSTAGFCYSKKITHRTGEVERTARIALNSKVLTTADRLRDTLIHEMCHAATWLINKEHNGHGEFWKAWTKKARKVFPELPEIKTCHNFEVQTKYVYRCTGCGYSIKRHRKSLDVERMRCGYCQGKFEILINKVDKNGGHKIVPCTPKKEPTGFALFVKQNYSNFKEPGRKHLDVMKLLGEKFKEMKVL